MEIIVQGGRGFTGEDFQKKKAYFIFLPPKWRRKGNQNLSNCLYKGMRQWSHDLIRSSMPLFLMLNSFQHLKTQDYVKTIEALKGRNNS